MSFRGEASFKAKSFKSSFAFCVSDVAGVDGELADWLGGVSVGKLVKSTISGNSAWWSCRCWDQGSLVRVEVGFG